MTEQENPPAFISAPPRHVLFLCTHNSARSQLAEGFARTLAPPGTRIWSAGTQPSKVNPLAIEVMKEVQIDISGQCAKRLAEVPWQQADTIVTLCGDAERECPQVSGKVRRVYWPLPDPASAPVKERLQAFREARDEIRWRVSSLWPRVE